MDISIAPPPTPATNLKMNRLAIWLLMMILTAPFIPDPASAKNVDTLERAAQLISDKLFKQWSPVSYDFLMDANECHDTKSDISLPFALLLNNDLSLAVRKLGYDVLANHVGNKRAVVVTCRWKTDSEQVRVTFQLMPWKNGKRGKGRITSVGIARSSIPASAFQADMDTWARTLIHLLGVGNKLEPTNIYQRPFQFSGIQADETTQSYFTNWFNQALSSSSLFESLDASKTLYRTKTVQLRKRGIRPTAKKGISLTGDLLGAKHELSGKIRIATEGDPASATGIDGLDVEVFLSKEDGERVSSATVRIPAAHVPPPVDDAVDKGQ